MVSRSVDKAQENKDIQEYEQKGQIVYLNKDLSKVCHTHAFQKQAGYLQSRHSTEASAAHGSTGMFIDVS